LPEQEPKLPVAVKKRKPAQKRAKNAKTLENSLQKKIDSRGKALFKTAFKQALAGIRCQDAEGQITGVKNLTDMFYQAVVDSNVSNRVINMFVTALILNIDALMVTERYQEVLEEIDNLKAAYPKHPKYLEEALRLEGLYITAHDLLDKLVNHA